LDAANAYPLAEFLTDLKADVFNAATPDANRRVLQRVYVERLGAIVNPPPAPAGGAGGGAAAARPGPAAAPVPFGAASNLQRSDIPALARAQLRQIRDDARRFATSAQGTVAKAHWQDIVDRVDGVLEAKRQ